MKVLLTMAMSANGMIATRDGNEDWLSNENWQQFLILAKAVGNFIWGRKTYEAVLRWGDKYQNDIRNFTKVIISSEDFELPEGYFLAHSPEEALQLLESSGFTSAIITGGATINSAFAEKGLIDEVRLDINPALVGNGIPLFLSSDFFIHLRLRSVEKITDQIIELTYQVKK